MVVVLVAVLSQSATTAIVIYAFRVLTSLLLDQLLELDSIEPHPPAAWADIDGDALLLCLAQSPIANGTLHLTAPPFR